MPRGSPQDSRWGVGLPVAEAAGRPLFGLGTASMCPSVCPCVRLEAAVPPLRAEEERRRGGGAAIKGGRRGQGGVRGSGAGRRGGAGLR